MPQYQGYHGTPYGFTKFKRLPELELNKKLSEGGNAFNSFFGPGYYFTSSPEDASENYADPQNDLRYRTLINYYRKYILDHPEQFPDILQEDGDYNWNKLTEEAKKLTNKQLSSTELAPNVIRANIDIDNPFIMEQFGYGVNKETMLDDTNMNIIKHVMAETSQKYNIESNLLWDIFSEIVRVYKTNKNRFYFKTTGRKYIKTKTIDSHIVEKIPNIILERFIRDAAALTFKKSNLSYEYTPLIIKDIILALGYDGIVLDAYPYFVDKDNEDCARSGMYGGDEEYLNWKHKVNEDVPTRRRRDYRYMPIGYGTRHYTVYNPEKLHGYYSNQPLAMKIMSMIRTAQYYDRIGNNYDSDQIDNIIGENYASVFDMGRK